MQGYDEFIVDKVKKWIKSESKVFQNSQLSKSSHIIKENGVL